MKKYVLYLTILLFVIQVSSRKLIFVQNLFRHGARYPIFLSKDDYTMQPQISKNAGELTIQGKNMHYILGKAFYKKYWQRLFNGTQSLTKYDHSQIYVRSTNVNRTIQSVQSQLRGWFQNLPPLQLKKQNRNFSLPAFWGLQDFIDLNYTNNQKWNVYNQLSKYQSVPIHVGLGGEGVSSSNPFDQGDFLIKFDKMNCPIQDEWVEENYNSQMSKYVQSLPKVKQALKKLQESFPSVEINFENAYKYIDNYECMKHLSQPVLSIFQDPNYSKTFKYIKQISLFLSLYYQPIQYQTTASGLFSQTVSNIKQAILGFGPKLVLYSAHDTTVALMLATFNLTNVNCINQYYLNNIQNYQYCVSDYPRFAANFVIQVYKQDDNNKYTMEIVFDNIRRNIPICGGQMKCDVEKFYKWVDSWYVKDPNKVCGIEDPFEIEYQNLELNQVRLYSAVIILTIIILLLLFWIYRLKKGEIKEQTKKQGYFQQFEEKDPNKNLQDPGSNQ